MPGVPEPTVICTSATWMQIGGARTTLTVSEESTATEPPTGGGNGSGYRLFVNTDCSAAQQRSPTCGRLLAVAGDVVVVPVWARPNVMSRPFDRMSASTVLRYAVRLIASPLSMRPEKRLSRQYHCSHALK